MLPADYEQSERAIATLKRCARLEYDAHQPHHREAQCENADLARLSPLAHAHVIPSGTYHFGSEPSPPRKPLP